MINLLPYERKEEIRAARVNIILVRYIMIILLAGGFAFAVLYTSLSVLQRTDANAQALIASNDTKAGVYSATKQQVDSLEAQLGEARTILDQEVRFSKVIVSIGQLMPSGTVLDSLAINSSLINGTPVQIKAYAKQSSSAVTLKDNLKASSLFSSIDIQSTSESGGIDGYPVVITMTVTFNRSGVR